jgi:rod shape-determining protein MreC
MPYPLRRFSLTAPLKLYGLLAVMSISLLSVNPGVQRAIADGLSYVALYPSRAVTSRVRMLLGVESENSELRRRVSEMSMEIARLKEFERENSRLRELMDFIVSFEPPEGREIVPARVVGFTERLASGYLVINRGERDGLNVNLPVISSKGLVGKIIEVRPGRATVATLLSRDCPVAVVLIEKGEKGMLFYSGGMRCEMRYLSPLSDVAPGDAVITSGLSEIFPYGLRVGRVAKVSRSAMETRAEVFLTVGIRSLEQVFILGIEEDLAKTQTNQ